jgi:hypothetical protein
MRIIRVHADAFGAMADRALELGPGLNVVVGPNESGKSTWHAALFAALCGLPPQADWSAADERFAAFRRPRGGSDWAVRAELELPGPAGTRRIAIAQNLLDPQASTIVDIDTGEDLSDQVDTKDGLDAARWLGFDRRSYAATSWIEQAGARSALVSTDGRTPLQMAVAACIREDEVDAALAQIDAVRRDHIGGPAGIGAHAAAIAEVRRRRADHDAADELAASRRDVMARLAAATGTAEIARKKLRAAKAFEARAEAERLRGLANQTAEAGAPAPIGTGRATVPGHNADPGESMLDVEVHSTVALAELELRTVEQAILDLAEGNTDGWRRLAGDHQSATGTSNVDYDEDDESAEADELDGDQPGDEPAGHVVWRDSAHTAPRRGWGVPTLDRIPGLRHIWGVHRIRGLEWVGDLGRQSLLRIGVVAAIVAVAGVALAIAFQTIVALVIGLLAAVVVLGVVAELTPGPSAEPIPVPWTDGPIATATPAASRPARPARVRPERPAAPTQSSMTNDLKLRHNAALTKLAAALIARGRRAHPFTAVADYDRYVLDCAEAAELRAVADQAADQRRNREQEAQRARVDAADRAERLADELEDAAEEYDLSMPYRQSVADAERAQEAAERDLEVAVAAMARMDATIAARPQLAAVEEGMARAEAVVARVERLDRVLQRAHTELTLAREAVLRDIASGLTPRLTDYLAQFTDRPYSTADAHDLQDQIGESLLRREPELGSFSTSESTFLFTRIALGQHLAGDAPQGPLLVDDITSSADTERIRRLLEIMRRISAQRQVVVFAHQSQVRNWALRQIGRDTGVRLIQLSSIGEDPQQVPPPPPAQRLTRQTLGTSAKTSKPGRARWR